MRKYFIFILAMALFSCVNPNGNPTPIQDPCSFAMSGDIIFNEMKLNYDDNSPFLWHSDHDFSSDGYVWDLGELLFHNNSSSVDDAYIDITVTGISCDGDKVAHYDKGSNQVLVGISSLSKTPYSADGPEVKIDLYVQSADYDGKRCVWQKSFDNKVLNRTSQLLAGDINGKWLSSSKSGDDGQPKKVYVYDTFNNYIYSL